ncbi:MAG: hypothetical protein GX588_07025 [Clostridiaceae bacterium]|nr:hypothetical protein [Clostridiaceae bacterium]
MIHSSQGKGKLLALFVSALILTSSCSLNFPALIDGAKKPEIPQKQSTTGSATRPVTDTTASASTLPTSTVSGTTTTVAVSSEPSPAPTTTSADLYDQLPASYHPYVVEPGDVAVAIFERDYDQYEEGAHKQAARTPGVIEFLVRRTLTDPGASAITPTENPFPDEQLPYFSQWDQRWGYNSYAGGFFGQTGCGPVVLSMVYTGLTGKEDKLPPAMGEFAGEQGYELNGNGTAWLLMSEGASKLGLTAEELPLSKSAMIKAVSEGRPIILVVGPGDFTSGGHYIVLRGLVDGEFSIYDPFSISNSQKLWSYEQLEGQIRNIWAYSQA